MSAATSLPSRRDTVLIADDNRAVLRTVSEVLSPQFQVLAAVRDGGAALDIAASAHPDLIVLDVQMPVIDGFRTARALAERKSSGKIVFLTGIEDNDFISEALNLGARGYIIKRRLYSDLIPALKLALHDQFFISPHCFSGTPTSEATTHVLQFYRDEWAFFRQVSDLAHAALLKNDLVFTFLSQKGIFSLGQSLRERGFDYAQAIASGQLHVFSVESILCMVLRENPPDLGKFDALFRTCLNRAIATSERGNRRLAIFSDLIGTLLKEGCGYELASCIEAVWNEMIPQNSCNVCCGCPLEHLGNNASRQTLSKICCDHRDVVTN